MTRHEVLVLLCRRFSKTFFMDERLRRPLKVGIYHDLVARLGDEVSRKDLRLALYAYTNSAGYLAQAKRVGAKRVDLGGKAAGSVSAAEAAHALAQINKAAKANEAA